ncbi:MAG: hypothetical protein MAG453_01314 [Calditrichaeota bacterium]|nr:hypothetical protein [Calditrichota bacterium]
MSGWPPTVYIVFCYRSVTHLQKIARKAEKARLRALDLETMFDDVGGV